MNFTRILTNQGIVCIPNTDIGNSHINTQSAAYRLLKNIIPKGMWNIDKHPSKPYLLIEMFDSAQDDIPFRILENSYEDIFHKTISNPNLEYFIEIETSKGILEIHQDVIGTARKTWEKDYLEDDWFRKLSELYDFTSLNIFNEGWLSIVVEGIDYPEFKILNYK